MKKNNNKYKYYLYDNRKSYVILLRFPWCNFKCMFCNVDFRQWEKKWYFKKRWKELIKFLFLQFVSTFRRYKIKNWNLIIDFSWWEPSLYKKELLTLCQKIKKYVLNKYPEVNLTFSIQTNASNIDEGFARDMFECGIKEALVSFHTCNGEIFEILLGVKKDVLINVVRWINNLIKAWIDVYPNIVLNKLNKDDFLNTLKFLVTNFKDISVFNIGVLQPHGLALNNIEKLFVNYEDVKDIYNRGIFFLRNNYKKVINHYVGLPPCYMLTDKFNLELRENYLFFRDKYLDLIWFGNKIGKIDEDLYIVYKEKRKLEKCRECFYNKFCFGIRKEYVDLKPVSVKCESFYKEFYKFGIIKITKTKVLLDNKYLSKINGYMKSKWFKGLVLYFEDDSLLTQEVVIFLKRFIENSDNYVYNITIFFNKISNIESKNNIEILIRLLKMSSFLIIDNITKNDKVKLEMLVDTIGKEEVYKPNLIFLWGEDKRKIYKIKSFLKYLLTYNKIYNY